MHGFQLLFNLFSVKHGTNYDRTVLIQQIIWFINFIFTQLFSKLNPQIIIIILYATLFSEWRKILILLTPIHEISNSNCTYPPQLKNYILWDFYQIILFMINTNCQTRMFFPDYFRSTYKGIHFTSFYIHFNEHTTITSL